MEGGGVCKNVFVEMGSRDPLDMSLAFALKLHTGGIMAQGNEIMSCCVDTHSEQQRSSWLGWVWVGLSLEKKNNLLIRKVFLKIHAHFGKSST